MAVPQSASELFRYQSLNNAKAENVKKFTYAEIRKATNDFSNFVGKGSFGTVYRGNVDGIDVAVKVLEKSVDNEFIKELMTLTRFKHENVLPVKGYCDDNKSKPCLVLQYMVNGSLEDRLLCKGGTAKLSANVRLEIAIGTARGINHLHTMRKKPIVHRDIKSANILLNEDFIPKVADFGLVRIGSMGNSSVREVTKITCGTRVYMAPEAFDGDVSTKLDTFSFGMVLLELLTGRPPKFKNKYLRTYTKKQILSTLLDRDACWDKLLALKIYLLSRECLNKTKKSRPTISMILSGLEKCRSLNGDSRGNVEEISKNG